MGSEPAVRLVEEVTNGILMGPSPDLRTVTFVPQYHERPYNRTLTEVARFIGLSQPTVHHDLVQLRAAGLVRVHFVVASPGRYSLRPHALEQLSGQLGAYLRAPAPASRQADAPRKETHR